MKTTQNRLCTLSMFASQAIAQKLTATIVSTLLTFLTTLSYVFAQNPPCSPKSNPLQHNNRCRTVSNGQPPATAVYDKTIMQVISSLGGAPGGCFQYVGNKNLNKKRSVFVNGMLNGAGYFGFVEKDQFQGSIGFTYYTNPNQEGNVFALDIDGDCTYEREDLFIDWLNQNYFDEINLYNISGILEKATRIIESVNSNQISGLSSSKDRGWSPTIGNTMMALEKAEYHLLRFVHKAKANGIQVNFILEGQSSNPDVTRFYKYNGDAGGLLDGFNDVCARYLEVALPGSAKNASFNLMPYISYEEPPILLLPKDDSGRISTLDKQLIDIYNMHVFGIRSSMGFITPGPNPCPNSPVANGCSGTFDAIVFENEWWDNHITNHDGELDLLEKVVEFARCFPNDKYQACEPKIYGTADYFNHPNWTNTYYTEQQRADKVDELFDRIYLYSYHSNPCDCYNGTQSDPGKEFWHKVELFRNNNRGGLINQATGKRETQIYPVFSAEYYEDDVNSVKHYTKPRYYNNSTGIETIGCNSSGSDCDFCTDYSGRFLNELNVVLGNVNNIFCPAEPGKRLGFVENIFQSQYDLDPTTSQASPLGGNRISGYSWLKSSTLQDNGITTKNGGVLGVQDQVKPEIQVFPVPTMEVLNITYNSALVREMFIYDLKGSVVFYLNGFDHSIKTSELQNGTYFLSLVNQDYSIATIKFIKE